ncbi:MAG: anaerobic ribonucleoside-triphosphate reductase activating protein [Chitinispirillales bacterium]|jgi:pyruvate formate lyase activating enzyme|nr:anaerobic ribonucleoside-triphosphate reductase activating protein [Chitinispirillales bacterium]
MPVENCRICGWQKSSFIDFPGTVSTVLFLCGCNLVCPYCHNPQIVRGEFEPVGFAEIKEYILKHKNLIDGAVISGGEPTICSDLQEICDNLRQLGLKIKLDTNGLLPEKITPYLPDYLALDIKTSFNKYTALLGAAYPDCTERLRQSIDIVKKMGENAEIRITAVPKIIDRDDIGILRKELYGTHRIFIQPFVPAPSMLNPAYSSVKPYPKEELEIWRELFLQDGIDCRIRAD